MIHNASPATRSINVSNPYKYFLRLNRARSGDHRAGSGDYRAGSGDYRAGSRDYRTGSGDYKNIRSVKGRDIIVKGF